MHRPTRKPTQKVQHRYNQHRDVHQVKINKCVVFARKYIDLQQPFPDSKDGKLRLNFNTSQVVQPSKQLWVPNLQSLEYGRVIETGLRANAIKLQNLAVTESQVCSISIQLHCFSVDGNIIDCGFVAAMLSLQASKIPFDKYQMQYKQIHWLNQDCYCKTLYNFEQQILQDTNVYQTACCQTGITFVISQSRIVALQKLRGDPISMPILKQMVNIVFEKYNSDKWQVQETDNICKDMCKTTRIIQ